MCEFDMCVFWLNAKLCSHTQMPPSRPSECLSVFFLAVLAIGLLRRFHLHLTVSRPLHCRRHRPWFVFSFSSPSSCLQCARPARRSMPPPTPVFATTAGLPPWASPTTAPCVPPTASPSTALIVAALADVHRRALSPAPPRAPATLPAHC